MSSKNKGKNKSKGGQKGGKRSENDDVPQVSHPQEEKKESPPIPEVTENVQNEDKTEKEETPTVHDQNSNTDVSRNQEPSQIGIYLPQESKLQTIEVTGQSKQSEHAEIPQKIEEPSQVQTDVETTAIHEEVAKKEEEPERNAQDRQEQVHQNVESSINELQNSEIKEEAKEQEVEPQPVIPEQRDSTQFQIISSGDFTKVENVQNLPIVEEENRQVVNNIEIVEQPQLSLSEHVEIRQDKLDVSQNENNPYVSTEILVEQKQTVPVEPSKEQVIENPQVQPETAAKVEEPAPQVIEEKPQQLNPLNEQKREEIPQENHIENVVPQNLPPQEEPQRQQQVNQDTQNQPQEQTSKVQPPSQTENNVQNPPSNEELIDLNRPIDQDSPKKNSKEERIFRLVESNEIFVNESNQISVEGSIQIKRSDEMKEVPVKVSLSFSDLNYSVERSPSASQEQERVPLVYPSDPVQQFISQHQPNPNESNISHQAPLLVQPPHKIFASQPVEILVDSDVIPSVPSEQFYSIIPQQPIEVVLQKETVVIEHEIIISKDGAVEETERVIEREVEQEIIQLNPQRGQQHLQRIHISIEPIILEQVSSLPIVLNVENIIQAIPEDPKEFHVQVNQKPEVEALPQPFVEALQQPVVEPVPEPVVEAVPESLVEAVPQSAIQVVPQPAVQVVPQPAVQVVPQPAVQVVPQTVVQVVPQPVVTAVPEVEKIEKVAASLPAVQLQIVNIGADRKVPLAQVIEEQKKDLSMSLQPSDISARELRQIQQEQIEPVQFKPKKSILKKLVISTAIGGVAGGVFYLFKSNKSGSVLLGLASLAASYFAV